jgi:predicted transcriptional regulator
MTPGGMSIEDVADFVGCTRHRVSKHISEDLKKGLRTKGNIVALIVRHENGKIELKKVDTDIEERVGAIRACIRAITNDVDDAQFISIGHIVRDWIITEIIRLEET